MLFLPVTYLLSFLRMALFLNLDGLQLGIGFFQKRSPQLIKLLAQFGHLFSMQPFVRFQPLL